MFTSKLGLIFLALSSPIVLYQLGWLSIALLGLLGYIAFQKRMQVVRCQQRTTKRVRAMNRATYNRDWEQQYN